MNYDRYLEIHLVSSKVEEGTTKIVNDGTRSYQYDFVNSVGKQRRAYRDKLQGRFAAAAAAFTVPMANMQVRPQQAQTLKLDHVISQGGPRAMQQLDAFHYVNCYVDLESLLPGQPVLPELQSLVKWVCAKQTASGTPIAGKMRLNSHGSNSSGAGLSMGESSLSPEDLVDALIRHGLGALGVLNKVSKWIASEPRGRWKADNEVKACENCKKAFKGVFFKGKHHCRRCGGIFCDNCTKKRYTVRNPFSEAGRLKGDVKECRVCDRCAGRIDNGKLAMGGLKAPGVETAFSVKAGEGLAQITLALCLNASSRQEFAEAKTGFVRNSIASRLVKRLSMKGIHGIQVSGSNEVVAWSGSGNQLVQCFDLKYPGMSLDKKPTTGQSNDPFEGTNFAGSQTVETSMTIPCFVLGSKAEPNPDPSVPPILDNATFAPIRNQRIVPVMGGNRMAFGRPASGQELKLLEQALRSWSMSSWRTNLEPVAKLPELTRQAGDLASIDGSDAAIMVATRPRKAELLGVTVPGSFNSMTWVIDAPQRRVTIKRYTLVPDTLIVTGFEERRYKDYKIYELS